MVQRRALLRRRRNKNGNNTNSNDSNTAMARRKSDAAVGDDGWRDGDWKRRESDADGGSGAVDQKKRRGS